MNCSQSLFAFMDCNVFSFHYVDSKSMFLFEMNVLYENVDLFNLEIICTLHFLFIIFNLIVIYRFIY